MKLTRNQLKVIIKEEKKKLLEERSGPPGEVQLWAEVPVQIRNIQMELEDILTLSADPGSLEEEVQDFIGDAVVNLSRTLSTLKVMWPRK